MEVVYALGVAIGALAAIVGLLCLLVYLEQGITRPGAAGGRPRGQSPAVTDGLPRGAAPGAADR